jgi:alkylated DNA repair dioxygenase AlkB
VSLFPPELPDGFEYRPDFLGVDEERDLAAAVGGVSFDTFQMHGVIARRRVKFYGGTYGEYPAADIPDFLLPLRARVAAWADVAAEAFAMALINEYTPGATIGWHRDAPQYELIAGVSLLSSCRMKLRPYVAPRSQSSGRTTPRKTTHEITLEPRSAYIIKGLARSGYEHSIPATESLRYSINFRTLR